MEGKGTGGMASDTHREGEGNWGEGARGGRRGLQVGVWGRAASDTCREGEGTERGRGVVWSLSHVTLLVYRDIVAYGPMMEVVTESTKFSGIMLPLNLAGYDQLWAHAQMPFSEPAHLVLEHKNRNGV